MSTTERAVIGVCVKWLAGQPQVVGSPNDTRYAGFSASDQAALELALQRAELQRAHVRVVAVAPAAARPQLVALAACGANQLVHIECTGPMASVDVAESMSKCLRDCTTIWCGDYSLDRGSGSVPAFLAALLGVPQALGVVEIDPAASTLQPVRRLDAGRREVLRLSEPGVISVEGSLATLRRASLSATLSPAVDIVTDTATPTHGVVVGDMRPYRPRPREAAPPEGATALERIRSTTAAGSAHTRGEIAEVSTDEAVTRVVNALREWGYLP